MKKAHIYIAQSVLVIITLFLGCVKDNDKNKFSYTQEEKNFITKIDSISQIVVDSLNITPGMAITIVKENKILLSKGYGVSDIVTNEALTNETMFYIASTTKSFVGLLASILHEEKIFSLNTTLKESFPNIKFNDSINPSLITMRHLLSHTSSITNSPLTFRLAYTGQINDSIALSLVKNCEPNGKTLGEYRYDNTGYNLYTIALKTNTGIEWKDALEQYVFNPLNMKNTSAYISDVNKKGLKIAKPYVTLATDNIDLIISAPLQKTDETMQSAGGLITNAKDLENWLLAHINDGKINNVQKIKSPSIESNHKGLADAGYSKKYDQPKSYTLGWEKIGDAKDSTDLLYHYGGYSGYSGSIFLSQKQKIGIASFGNSTFSTYATDIIKDYTLNYFIDPDKAEKQFSIALKKAYDDKQQIYQHFKRDSDNRKERKWEINFENDYNGNYYNETRGTINISQKDTVLTFKYGNIKTIAQPYVQENTVRVEFKPLRGEAILFDINFNGIVQGLFQNGHYFKKTIF